METALWLPPFISSVAVVFLWTILVRVFPSILSVMIEKRIEHQYNKKLESTKAELQASYSSVGTSVGFLSAVQPELRLKIIESVERICRAVHSFKEHYKEIIFLDSMFLPEEIQNGLISNDSVISPIVSKYGNLSTIAEMIKRDGALVDGIERLHVGDQLWLIFSTIRMVYGRFGALVHESCNKRQYVDWRKDKHFISNLRNVLSEDFITNAKSMKIDGLNTIISQLESELHKEGARVMSGSQWFAEALFDVQAAVKFETSKIAQEKELQAM